MYLTKGIHYYTPEVYEDSGKLTFRFRLLSHKELEALSELFDENKQSIASVRCIEFAVEFIEDSLGNSVDITSLPFSVVKEVASHIISKSVVTPEQVEKLNTSLVIHFNESMESDSWNCEICKSKRLDKLRNCGYLDYNNNPQYYNKDFKLQIGKNTYTHCPIYDIDKTLLSAAIEAYNLKDMGFLPDEGGWFDQTRFFTIAVQLVSEQVYLKQKRELDKASK